MELFETAANADRDIAITNYMGESADVEIPPLIAGKPVTAIGKSAFAYNKLTSVVISKSVTSIGYRTFAYNALTSMVIPAHVTHIGYEAFYENQLERVVIGANVKLNENAFDGDFNRFYNDNRKQAGTYTFHNAEWRFSAH
jgi:hypothetical protein